MREVVVGIDEAGYGPTLGPMVVSAVAIAMPDRWQAGALWRSLSPAVYRPGARRPLEGAVAIGDSKAVYSPGAGLRRLETSVLAFLRSAGIAAESLRGLLRGLALGPAGLLTQMAHYPWYRGQSLPLPVVADAEAIATASRRLSARCANRSIELLAIRCAPLLVRQYNMQVRRTDNKAAVLFAQTARLMNWALDRHGDGRIHILADKQGGRRAYERLLAQAFCGALISKLRESRQQSAYLLRRRAQNVTVTFSMQGDAQYVPVAMASMVSKYLRELFMVLFNRFWQGRIPQLQRTAGYPVDAWRFVTQTAGLRRKLRIDDRLMIRVR